MDVFVSRSLEEALELRAAHPEATPVAGGTDLMVGIVATPAIVSALRAATGRTLHRVPVAPDDLLGLRPAVPTPGRPPVPDVAGQQAIPEYAGLGLGQQELMEAR